jgi:hypothetical protein
MRQPAEHLVAAVLVDDRLGDHRGEPRHPIAEPFGHMPAMERKVGAARSPSHSPRPNRGDAWNGLTGSRRGGRWPTPVLRARREITKSLLRTHLLHDVMFGAGGPSMARGAELTESVDGRHSPTMPGWGDYASTAALVLRQDLTVTARR